MAERIYVTSDDEGNIVRTVDEDKDGQIHVYDATDGDYEEGHGHEVYSSMDAFLDSQVDSSAGEDVHGDIYSRPSDSEESKGRDWDDRNCEKEKEC